MRLVAAEQCLLFAGAVRACSTRGHARKADLPVVEVRATVFGDVDVDLLTDGDRLIQGVRRRRVGCDVSQGAPSRVEARQRIITTWNSLLVRAAPRRRCTHHHHAQKFSHGLGSLPRGAA
jgi:hypothetical protein